jgi:hypothetical protein
LKRYAHQVQGKVTEPWSFTAFWDRRDHNVKIEKIESNETIKFNDADGRQYHLSSPREWLEATEQRDGTFGVYTVMRCDVLNNNAENKRVRSWGQDFHLERLSSSYKMLYNSNATDNALLERAASTAFEESLFIYSTMLSHAIKQVPPNSKALRTDRDDCSEQDNVDVDVDYDCNEIYTVMVTLLWQPRNGNVQDIQVRGHAFCTNKPLSSIYQYDPMPITAAVAFWKNATSALPSRYDQMPTAKVSSWCRLRRPLEHRIQQLDPDVVVGEVILVRNNNTNSNRNSNNNSKVELLEGLTSNLFVVYSDGTLRTPMGSVLNGYARKLVIEAAQRMGWTVTHDPIYLEDATNGLWKEVFLTSSIRLVVPVGKVLIPTTTTENECNDGENMSFRTLWSERDTSSQSVIGNRSKNKHWYTLYQDIVKHNFNQSYNDN